MSKKRFKPARPLALLLLPILAGCGTPQIPPPGPTTGSQTSALACIEFSPLTFAPGKPNATKADVESAMAANPANPVGAARGIAGDTLTTRAEIDAYAARRRALGCRP